MRQVDTRFWVDSWVRKLNALDRYAFLYFLTNTHSSWCGVYELDISMAAFECGIDEHDLEKSILPRLSPKIIYISGWVYIKNFEKYHENKSAQTKKGIENAWIAVPEKIRLEIAKIDTPCRPPIDPLVGASPSSSSSSSSSSYSSSSISTIVDDNDFSIFWNLYDKKVNQTKCKTKWNKLNLKDKNLILEYLPKYKLSTPDKKYRKNPETFFNNRSWEDEILSNKPKQIFL